MGKSTQWRVILSVIAAFAATLSPAAAATISLGTILANFNGFYGPEKNWCKGAKNEGCPVTFVVDGKDKTGYVYLSIIRYNPKEIPKPGQKITLTFPYKVMGGGSLIVCNTVMTSGPGGACADDEKPASNNVAGVLSFPVNTYNIIYYTGNMEKDADLGASKAYVQFNYLYSEYAIKTPDLGIGTTPIEITDKGVTGYFRKIQGGRNERLFLILPIPEPSTWMLMLMGLGGLGIASRVRSPRSISSPA